MLYLGILGLTRVRMTLLLASTIVRLRPLQAQNCRAYGKSRKNFIFLRCPKLCSYYFGGFFHLHPSWKQSCRAYRKNPIIVLFNVSKVILMSQAQQCVIFQDFSICGRRQRKVAVPMPKLCSYCFTYQVQHFIIFHMKEMLNYREAEVTVPIRKIVKAYFFDML